MDGQNREKFQKGESNQKLINKELNENRILIHRETKNLL